jgi:hypothetical protein
LSNLDWFLDRARYAIWVSALFCGGCTALVDADRVQCKTDADCTSRGPAFAEAICEESVCKPKPKPEAWACLDEPPETPPVSSGTYTVNFFLRDTVSQEPKGGVNARSCRRLDPDCSSSTGDVTTNADGRVAMSLPAGFEGYIQFEGADIATTLYFFDPPLSANVQELMISVNTPMTAAGLVQLTGATPNPDLGVVLVTTYDCKGAAATGVSVTPGGVGDAAKLFYVRNGLPDTTKTVTDETGYAGIVNAMPGTASFTSTFDDLNIGSVTVQVKKGAQTLARINPNGT